MTSILPNQILPPSVPVLNADGTFNKDWYLFLYNIAQQVLGTNNASAAAFAVQLQADVDADADVSDFYTLFNRVAALEQSLDPPPSVAQAQLPDEALVDPVPRAQPVQTVSVGASPFTYTAPFDGTVIVTGGTVSSVQLSRDGTTFYTVTGCIPVSRLDQVKVTYSGLPTMVLFPR